MIKENYKLLKTIEAKPRLWTGDNTLKSIHIYLGGYHHALKDYELVKESEDKELFFDWVANKLGFNESTAGWANMILASTLGFDRKNINWNVFLDLKITEEEHKLSIIRFYELLEDYIKTFQIIDK